MVSDHDIWYHDGLYDDQISEVDGVDSMFERAGILRADGFYNTQCVTIPKEISLLLCTTRSVVDGINSRGGHE